VTSRSYAAKSALIPRTTVRRMRALLKAIRTALALTALIAIRTEIQVERTLEVALRGIKRLRSLRSESIMMMLYDALNRDMELLLRIFSFYDQNVTYQYVYSQYITLHKQLGLFQTELETLTRWRWKYQFLTLRHFKEYY